MWQIIIIIIIVMIITIIPIVQYKIRISNRPIMQVIFK